MGACDTWNVEINILVYENKMFLLPTEFYSNNWNKISLPIKSAPYKKWLKMDLWLIYENTWHFSHIQPVLSNFFFFVVIVEEYVICIASASTAKQRKQGCCGGLTYNQLKRLRWNFCKK